MSAVTLDPVNLGNSRIWSITVEVLRDGMPVVITPSMRAGNPMDSTLYSARLVRRITRRDDNTTVIEYAPTIVEMTRNSTATVKRDNVYLRALRMAISARRKLARLHSVSERSDGINIPLFAPMLATSLHPPDAIEGLFANKSSMSLSSCSDPSESKPIYVQRKYDGLRAIGTIDGAGVPILYGRRAIIFTSPAVSRIKSELARIISRTGIYIDGELYVHGMSLQEIESAATNSRATTSLNFVVYDMFTIIDDGVKMPFSARLAYLRTLLDTQEANAAIRCAETFTCHHTDAITTCVRELFARFLREGYEGAIVRIDGRAYEHKRSNALIKIKLAHDAEFRVVAFTSALRGSSRGALLFVCEGLRPRVEGDPSRDDASASSASASSSQSLATFTVTPTGSISARRSYMKQVTALEPNGRTSSEQFVPTDEARKKWLGKYIIVKFDALSRDGIPLRARTDGTVREVM